MSQRETIGIGDECNNATVAQADQDRPDLGLRETSPRTHGFGRTESMRRTPSPPARYVSAGRNMRYENVRRPPSGTVSTRRDAPEALTGRSSTAADVPYAATGIKRSAATTNHRDTSMNALVAENRHTELKNAVSQRRQSP